jgi:hypothetical protein
MTGGQTPGGRAIGAPAGAGAVPRALWTALGWWLGARAIDVAGRVEHDRLNRQFAASRIAIVTAARAYRDPAGRFQSRQRRLW